MEKSLFDWIMFLLKEYGQYFWQGTVKTLEVAVIGTILGFVLGFIAGVIQSTPISSEDSIIKKIAYRTLKVLCNLYVRIFRGTPMMVQAMVLYYGLRQSGFQISPFLASVVVILLNTGAYMAETVRGGMQSIDSGQFEGGKAMGMSHGLIMINIILPQTFMNIFPEMGNNFVTNLKMTSVLNVIGISELYFATKTAANTYYKYFEAYLITGLIYLILCEIFTLLFALFEKKLQGKNDYELCAEYLEE